MNYSLLVVCEITGSGTADTDRIVNDFTERFIASFENEAAAIEAVLSAMADDENAELIDGEVFIDAAGSEMTRYAYFAACEYAFRDRAMGKPDELSIIVGLSCE